MGPKKTIIPDSTAVRVALWRTLHLELDARPYIVEDTIGIKLVEPEANWRERMDMHPQGTAPFRASIVARARFVEDLVEMEMKNDLNQYVVLGAGLDTFAQRRTDLISKLNVFEIEKPDTQEWKRKRLIELGYQIPAGLKFVPVDFESGESWWKKLQSIGFETNKKAVVTSLGVSMYLTREAIKDTLIQMKNLATGSKFIMTFLLPLEEVAEEDRFGFERSIKGAQMSGTPFISFFTPVEMLALAREVGFSKIEHRSTSNMPEYFANRSDGLRASTGEDILIVTI